MMLHRSHSRILALVAGAALGLPCATLAQVDNPRSPSPPRAPDRTERTEKTVVTVRATPVLIASKAIMGTNVVSTSGDKLGDVNDLLIATKPGRVQYIVVSRGGVAGVGDTLYAVPFSAFEWDEAKKQYILPVSEDRIKNAPKLEGTDWKLLAQDDRRKQLHEYYTVEADDRMHVQYDDRDWGRRRDDAALQRWPILRASDIKGQTLMSDEGSELGTIKDIVLDRTSGRVAFAVVSFGGTLGLGNSLVAVPWDLFDVNTEGKVFATKMDKEQIKAAPRLEGDDWKELRDGNYIRTQYKHFGRDAEWLTTASADAPDRDRDITRDTGGDRSGDTRYAAYDQCYMVGQKADLEGTAENISTNKGSKDVPQVVVLTVNSEEHRNVPVHLAPETYLKEQGVALKPGEKVTLHGRWCEVEGHRCFIVSEITPASGKTVTLRRSDGTRVWR